MGYLYLKALHIIFIVTWFAGMFYIVRLFIYNREANDLGEPEKGIIQKQFGVMMTRLWLGITWPSAVITLILGPVVLFTGKWQEVLFDAPGRWLLVKLCFVLLLYLYHWSLHRIYLQQKRGEFRQSSQQLRLWNELATLFLVAIVMLAVVKTAVSFVWGLLGMILLALVLVIAIRIYRRMRP